MKHVAMFDRIRDLTSRAHLTGVDNRDWKYHGVNLPFEWASGHRGVEVKELVDVAARNAASFWFWQNEG